MYKAYLFDFDGTLVDSMPTFRSVMIKILDENNVKYEKDILKTITPLGALGIAKYYREELGMKKSEEEILSLIVKYLMYEYKYNIKAKNNVVPVLGRLKELGANLHILTASPHITLDPCVERLGIGDFVTNVWSCDDFKTTKTNPDIYRMAAEKIGCPIDEILFLDDNFNADKTAKTVGMKVCGVFDESSKEYEEEMKSLCDYYIYDFSELLKIEE